MVEAKKDKQRVESLEQFVNSLRNIVHTNLTSHMHASISAMTHWNRRPTIAKYIQKFDKNTPDLLLLVCALRIKTIFHEIMEKKGI